MSQRKREKGKRKSENTATAASEPNKRQRTLEGTKVAGEKKEKNVNDPRKYILLLIVKYCVYLHCQEVFV